MRPSDSSGSSSIVGPVAGLEEGMRGREGREGREEGGREGGEEGRE